MTIRVALVDDHTVVRQGLRLLLESASDFVVCGEASDGQELLPLVQTCQPDVVVLDLIMPVVNGVEALRHLRAAGHDCKVLVLTSSLQDTLLQDAMAVGANGYFLKTSSMPMLLDAVRRVARGETALDPLALHTLISAGRRVDPLDALTVREREVFYALARGLTYAEIAQQLVVSEATVRTHGTNVLDKLGLRDRTQVMVFALKRGLVQPDDLP